MAKQKNAKRKNQSSTTKAKFLAKSSSAVEANEGRDDRTTLDVKRLAVMLFILGITVIIPLAYFLSNVDGMTEDVFRNKYNNDASRQQHQSGAKASKYSDATAEKKKEKKSIQNKPLIDPSKFKSSWDMAMYFSKDYDSLGSKCFYFLRFSSVLYFLSQLPYK